MLKAIVNISLLFVIFHLNGCAPVIVVGGAAGAAALATDARSTGSVIDDQSVEFKIAGNLQADEELAEQAHISVTSYNGNVLLTGEAPSAELRLRAFEIAESHDKVRKVFNEITIAEPLPAKARNYDTWLTTKVKSKLLGADEVNAFNIKVVTSNTTVYLMGIITQEKGQQAAQVVAQVDGVNKVVKAFEYIQEQ